MKNALALSALIAVAMLPAGARAQADMRGTYTLNRAASGDVNKAIEVAIKGMSFVVRPVARLRLRKSTPVFDTLTVKYDNATITTQLDLRPPITAPVSGEVIKWKREDGEVFDLSAKWEGTTIVQTFRAEDGMRENRFSISPDGKTLTLRVMLNSPRLPRAVEYTLVYNRTQ